MMGIRYHCRVIIGAQFDFGKGCAKPFVRNMTKVI